MTDVIFPFTHPKNAVTREMLKDRSKREIEETAFECGVLATLDFILKTAGPKALMEIRSSHGFKFFDVSDEQFEKMLDDFRKEGFEPDMKRLESIKGDIRKPEDVARFLNEFLFHGDWEKQLEWTRKKGRTKDVELLERMMIETEGK